MASNSQEIHTQLMAPETNDQTIGPGESGGHSEMVALPPPEVIVAELHRLRAAREEVRSLPAKPGECEYVVRSGKVPDRRLPNDLQRVAKVMRSLSRKLYG